VEGGEGGGGGGGVCVHASHEARAAPCCHAKRTRSAADGVTSRCNYTQKAAEALREQQARAAHLQNSAACPSLPGTFIVTTVNPEVVSTMTQCEGERLTVAMMHLLAHPPRDSCEILVSLNSRYGTCGACGHASKLLAHTSRCE
jgi:hypothetical protein